MTAVPGGEAPTPSAVFSAAPPRAGAWLGGTMQGWGPIDPSRVPVAAARPARRGVRPAPVAQVRIGDPISEGSLPRGIVRRYLRRNHARFEYCYHRALLGTPTLAGDLTFTFVIDSFGRVGTVEESGLGGDLAQCARAVLEWIEFPAPLDGRAVRARFTLAMAQPAGGPPPPRRRPAARGRAAVPT